MAEKDPTIESAKFDPRVFGGDVDGPGMVSPRDGGSGGRSGDGVAGAVSGSGFSLKAEPPPTKRVSRNVLNMAVAFAVLVLVAVVFGVSSLKTNAPGSTSPQDNTNSAMPTPAPNLKQVAESLKNSNPSNAASSGNGNDEDKKGDGPLNSPGRNQQTAKTGPSHADQFKDWVERHKYDRARARMMAEDQAYTAQLATKSTQVPGAARAQKTASQPDVQLARAATPAGSAPSAASAPASAAPSVYTGQPRPDRIDAASQLPALAAAAARQAGVGGVVGIGGADTQSESARAAAAKASFADSKRDVGYLQQDVRDPRSGHEIAAGSIIPAVMLSAINSDLPGAIVAQTRSDVYSTFDYKTLLVPAGSRIVGRYQSDIATGQERILVVWDELIFPNGRRISLEGMGAVDGTGAAGMKDQVTTHFWRIWGNALMISALGVGVQLSQPKSSNQNNTPTASQQAAAAAFNSLNDTAQQVLRRNLQISPTLEIRPGYVFNIMVNKSMSLPAYRDE